jgi:hypothetical protein
MFHARVVKLDLSFLRKTVFPVSSLFILGTCAHEVGIFLRAVVKTVQKNIYKKKKTNPHLLGLVRNEFVTYLGIRCPHNKAIVEFFKISIYM